MTNVTDIEEIVKTWAYTSFVKTRSKEYAKLDINDINMDVNWKRVQFLPSPPEYSQGNMVDHPHSKTVFSSTFENNTDSEQEHSFTTERTTICTSTTSVSKGYTKGMCLELKIGLPDDVASATAGFGREVNVEKASETTNEHSITWAVNTNIKVPGRHKTTAQMVVKEKEYNGKFKVTVKISGIVIVNFTNLKDNNSFIHATQGDISQILARERRADSGYDVTGKTVTWVVEGTTQFRFGVEQRVKINEEKI